MNWRLAALVLLLATSCASRSSVEPTGREPVAAASAVVEDDAVFTTTVVPATTIPETLPPTTLAPPTSPTQPPPLSAQLGDQRLSGEWKAISVLGLDNEMYDLSETTANLSIRGRTFGGSDGCNFWGLGSVIFDDSSIAFEPGMTTLAGCFDPAHAAFHDAVVGAREWTIRDDGSLTLGGLETGINFERTESVYPMNLEGATLRFAIGWFTPDGQDEVEVQADDPAVLLRIGGQNATLSSSDCELAFTVHMVSSLGNSGAFSTSGLDASACSPGSHAHQAATLLASSDFFFGDQVSFVVWEGPAMRAAFVNTQFELPDS